MKKLLFSLIIVGASTASMNAQIKTWDFNGDRTGFPLSSTAIASTKTVDGLTLEPGTSGSSFGIVDGNAATIAGVSYTTRFRMGGASYPNGTTAPNTTPTRRYMYFPVTGPVKVKVYFKGGSGRTLFIHDGANVLAPANTPDFTGSDILEVNYTGGAGTLTIANSGDQFSLYKIEVFDAATMAVVDAKSGLKATAFSSGNKIYISDLASKKTDVKVYSTTGSLVKSLKTSEDTNFDINAKGLYIVNLKSEAGEKSVKVLIK